LFYESHYPLGMHLRFRNQRRSQVTPLGISIRLIVDAT
jgi:hypothetical protein